jgi:beta-lactamase class A
MVPGSGILKELSEGLEITYRDLIELMMILSDNTATDLIVDKVGIDNINSTLKELGFEKTKVVVGCREILFDLIGLDKLPIEEKTIDLYREKSDGVISKGTWSLGVENNDVTTPNEMLKLLEMIAMGDAVSQVSSETILTTMKKCQTGAYRLAKYLPRDRIDFAHKTGSLPGIRNDVGIITFRENKHMYIICCLTRQAEDVYEAEEVIARVSQSVYRYFASD